MLCMCCACAVARPGPHGGFAVMLRMSSGPHGGFAQCE